MGEYNLDRITTKFRESLLLGLLAAMATIHDDLAWHMHHKERPDQLVAQLWSEIEQELHALCAQAVHYVLEYNAICEEDCPGREDGAA
jgi:hypothetical protein